MVRPINPNLDIPAAFAVNGTKTDFTNEKLQSGFDDTNPDILAGDNLNKLIDDTYKGLNFAIDGVEDLYDVSDTKADDNAVVHKTGNETISGTKTFSGSITTGSNNFVAIQGTNVYIKNGTPTVTITAINGHLVEDGNKVIDVTDLATTSTAGIVQPDGTSITVAGGIITADCADKDLSNLTLSGDARLHALKGYEDDGELLTDAEGLSDVQSYAHSTYDSSKFTSLIHGTPTITSDGVMYGNYDNSVGSGLSMDTSLIVVGAENRIKTKYTYQKAGVSGFTQIIQFYRFDSSTNNFTMQVSESNQLTVVVDGTNHAISTSTLSLVEGQSYIFELDSDFKTYLKAYVDGTEVYSDTALSLTYSACAMFRIGNNASWQSTRYNVGALDLKYLEIKNDGVPVFSGNKTDIDTYTIGGNTVTIPYTLSKTGSKIVDSAYRTQVTSVYNEFGYAPYYTLDGVNGNFTLPQGEIYGMMLNQSTPHVVETYVNGTSSYELYSPDINGKKLLIQRGLATTPDNTGSVVVNLYKNYDDTDYYAVANQTYGTTTLPDVTGVDMIATESMTTSSFRVVGSTNADTPVQEGTTIYWETKGYIS